MEKSKKNIYWTLFVSTFALSAFTFGGGYVIIPLMQKKFCDDLKWLEEEEMLNLAAIAQSSPGAVAVNASILVGFRVAGVFGAATTILGTVLPPLIILSVISLFYQAFRTNLIVTAVLKGMQAGVGAVIADVVLNLGGKVCKQKSMVSLGVMVGAFIATFFFGVNVMYIVLTCAMIGALQVTTLEKVTKKAKARVDIEVECAEHLNETVVNAIEIAVEDAVAQTLEASLEKAQVEGLLKEDEQNAMAKKETEGV